MDKPKTSRSKVVPATISYHHGDLRNALVREARSLLETEGATEFSLAEVARRVGVSDAAPFRHFEGKEALLAAIAATGFEELEARRQAITASGMSPLEKVRLMLLDYVKYAQHNKGVFNLMVGPRILDPSRHADLREVGTKSFRHFADAVIELAKEYGWPPRELDRVVHSAWAMEHGLATLILANRAPSRHSKLALDEMIDFATDMSLSSIAAGPLGLSKVQKRKAAGPRKTALTS